MLVIDVNLHPYNMGKDAASGMGTGFVPKADAAMNEFGEQHRSKRKVLASHGIGAGMLPTATAARGEDFLWRAYPDG